VTAMVPVPPENPVPQPPVESLMIAVDPFTADAFSEKVPGGMTSRWRARARTAG
jgi:hypothetical protein